MALEITSWEGIADAPWFWYGGVIATTSNMSMTLAIGDPGFGYSNCLIYQSLDKGCSWEGLTGLPADNSMQMLALSSDTGQYAYMVNDSMVIYGSSDFAQNWQILYQPSPVNESMYFFEALGLITNPSGQYVASCGFQYTDKADFVVTSTDYGTTWTRSYLPDLCWSLAADANFSTIWLSGLTEVMKSTDKGESWTSLAGFDMRSSKFLVSHSGQYISLVGAGSYFSIDYGDTWTALADGSPLSNSTAFYEARSVASDASGRFLAVLLEGGYQDLAFYLSSDFGLTWQMSFNVSDTFYNGLASSADGSVVLSGGFLADPNRKLIVAGSRGSPTSSYCPSSSEDPVSFPRYAIIIIVVVGAVVLGICCGCCCVTARRRSA